MNIFSFLLYFWKEKNYLIYCINKTTNYIASWLFTKKKKHHARYVCQSVLYNGWLTLGPRTTGLKLKLTEAGGTSSKNRLQSPLIYIYIYIYIFVYAYMHVFMNMYIYICSHKYMEKFRGMFTKMFERKGV